MKIDFAKVLRFMKRILLILQVMLREALKCACNLGGLISMRWWFIINL